MISFIKPVMDLEIMDRISYEYYFSKGPKPDWTDDQWQRLRLFQAEKTRAQIQETDRQWMLESKDERKEKLQLWKNYYNLDDDVFNQQLDKWCCETEQ